MSFFRKILPQVDKLIQEHHELGTCEFVRKFSKYDALQGSEEAIEYVKKILSENNQTSCTTCQR